MEKNETLPKGWISAKIADLVIDPKQEIVDGPFGSNLKATEYVEKGVPLIRLQNVSRNSFVDKNIKYVTNEKAIQLKRHNFKNNDIVITKLGAPLGEACLVPEYLSNGIIVADIVRIRLNHEFISKKFLMHQINSNKIIMQFKIHTKGTTRPRVNLKQIRDFDIVIPPLNEQNRICDKIEVLFSLVDSTKQLLEKTKILLKQYSRSILKLAFEGKLVAQDPSNKHTSIFSKEFEHEELSTSIPAMNMPELNSSGNTIPKNLVNFPYGDIPKSWKILELQQISKIIDSLHMTPKYSSEGIPMVRSTEIKYGDLNLKHAFRVSKEIYDAFTRNYKPKRNDIVMSRVGTYFVTSFVNTDDIFCMGQNTLVIHPLIDSRYLYYMLNSRFVTDQIDEKLVGTSGQRTLSLKNIRGLMILVPPINEQMRIVTKIEESISLIQNSERQVDSLLLHNGLMKNSILNQAFEGKLVPQDPNDEPASELLKRIKSQK